MMIIPKEVHHPSKTLDSSKEDLENDFTLLVLLSLLLIRILCFKKRLEVLMRPFVSKVTTVDLLIADVYQSQNCRGDSNHQS